MSRYKDGRTQTAFRLSNEEIMMLGELADNSGISRSAMVRLLIKRSYGRKVMRDNAKAQPK